MDITLRYGRGGLPLHLPDTWDVTVLRKTVMPVLADPGQALEEMLASPLDSAPLTRMATGSRTACILVCDITRPVPNGVLLPALIRTLLDSGITPGNITVLVATGLHRPNEDEEVRGLIGSDWVLETVTVANHFARNDADHADLGRTRRGTPIKLDRRFVDADVRIVTGLVEPHFMAGYSGGRKVITPGIAHAETITTLHSAAILEDPQARNCQLLGNPLHEEQLEIAHAVGEIFAVNVVLDEERHIAHLTCGALEASHHAAVDFLQRYSVLEMSETFPTVVSTSAGYPLDTTYYQAIKGMVGAQEILAPGGMLLLAAECANGMGSAEFVEAQRRLLALGPQAFLAELHTKSRAAIDEWQTEMLCRVLLRGQIALFSEKLSADDTALTGVSRVTSLQDALEQRVTACGDPHIAIIPEGPYLIPTHADIVEEVGR